MAATATTTTTSFQHHHHHSSLSLSPSHSSSFLSFPTKPRSLKLLLCLSIKQPNDYHQLTTTINITSTTTAKNNDDPPQELPDRGLRVVLAAGDTGSHIIPAVAIADELKTTLPNTEFLFIGTPNSMESSTVKSAGYPFSALPPYRLSRPLLSLKNVSLPYHLIKSTIRSFKILGEFNPDVVIGTGGYVSLPTCLAALIRGVKVVIQEPNSVPGLANYILSRFCDVVFVAFNSTVEYFPVKHNCVVSGNPVRLSLKHISISKETATVKFFPKDKSVEGEDVKVILVLGGSLGANSLNIALEHLYSQLLAEHENWYVIWQTGVEVFNEMESLVKNHPHLVLAPFLHRMNLAYAAADLVVSRAGAMTCSEILATGKPAILVPSPDIEEGHQFKNASLMADVAGSRVITEDELDSITLGTTIVEILGDKILMEEMSDRALKAAKPDACVEIVQHIISLVESSPTKKIME